MEKSLDQATMDSLIHQANGHPPNDEYALNNEISEPTMYLEHGCSLSDITNRVTVVDIFDSEASAQSAVQEMEQKGLKIPHVSIVAKNYKDARSTMNWENINSKGGLTVILRRLAIVDSAISRFIEAIDNGNFLVIEVGNDRKASQLLQVLETGK
jgi:hypothetical protein